MVRWAVEVGLERGGDTCECGGVIVGALGLPGSEVVLRDGSASRRLRVGVGVDGCVICRKEVR